MSLISWLGQKLQPQAKAVTDDLGIGSVINRWSDYPSFNLTPERLRSILWQADQGYMRYLMELYEEMEEKDAHLAAILQTRKLAVLGLPLEISPASEDAKDQEIAEFVEAQLNAIPDFKSDLLDLLDAIGKGFSASEIHWDYQNKTTVVADLEWIHAKCVSFVNSPDPLIITETNGSGIVPPPWKVIFHRYRGRSGDVCRGGVLRSCTLPYLLKAYNWKFWAIFNEVFGMPMRVGTYENTASKEDREALKEALKSLGMDAYAVISKNTQIEFKESSMSVGGKMLPYQVLIQMVNSEMSKAVLGQTLTTDTAGATGTYAAGAVHENVRQDLVQADAKDLAAVLRDQLVRPLVGFNYGWDAPLPLVALVSQEAIDFKMESEAIQNFAESGLAIPASHCYQRYGIPKPEADEDVLKPPVNIRPAPASTVPGEAPGTGQEPAAMKSDFKTAREWVKKDLIANLGYPLAASLFNSTSTDQLTAYFLYDGKTYLKELKSLTDKLLLLRDGPPSTDHIQQELDNLTQAANAEAQAYLGKMLAPAVNLIDSGESLEVIKGKLLELYSRIDTRDLEVLMGQVRIMANLRGRVDR